MSTPAAWTVAPSAGGIRAVVVVRAGAAMLSATGAVVTAVVAVGVVVVVPSLRAAVRVARVAATLAVMTALVSLVAVLAVLPFLHGAPASSVVRLSVFSTEAALSAAPA